MKTTAESRTAIARAEFFLDAAERCATDETLEFEAYMEAATIFGRTAIHRADTLKGGGWLKTLSGSAVEFFRDHRDFTLKEASPKIGQVVRFGAEQRAADMYTFEHPNVRATDTVRRYLRDIRTLIGTDIR